jgi:hypothetical protein
MHALDDHDGGGCDLLCHRGPTIRAAIPVAIVYQRLEPPLQIEISKSIPPIDPGTVAARAHR